MASPAEDRPRDIPLSKLLLDQTNARLGDEQADQESAILALVERLGSQFYEMASDIVKNGIDPSASLIVTPEAAPAGKFRVLEGNRRTLAVKALTRPEIVRDFLTPARFRRFIRLSEEFSKNRITRMRCVVFQNERDADHWIELRHTGANNGVGLVEWDSNDQDRWRSRRGGPKRRTEAGQILDFVETFHPARPGDASRLISTLQRIVGIERSQNKLGLTVEAGIVHSHYPIAEVLKGLYRIVSDLRSASIKVMDVYTAELRDAYIDSLTADELPNPSTRLTIPVALNELSGADSHAEASASGAPFVAQDSSEAHSSEIPVVTDGRRESTAGAEPIDDDAATESPTAAAVSAGARKSRVKPAQPRPTVIPRTCHLWVDQPRINVIYHELVDLDIERFTNACAVTLRVFIELSVDHHLILNGIMSEQARRDANLAKRLKELAKYLRANTRIDERLEKAIIKVADGPGLFSATTTTFNQYVHNSFAYPQPSELRITWDEIEPFMCALWKK